MALLTLLVCLCGLGFYVYHLMWLQPEKIRQQLIRQGIRGPKPSFYLGNILEMKKINSTKKVNDTKEVMTHEFKRLPCFDIWRKQYGPIFMFSNGNNVTVYVSEPNLVKEMVLCTSLDIGKQRLMKKNLGALIGQSILTVNGHEWAHDRKIIASEFYMDKIKGMVDLMTDATLPVLQLWKSRIELQGGTADIMVDEDLKNLSADIISRACFGSNYLKGQEIFSKLRALQVVLSGRYSSEAIPGFRYIPNKSNREIWKLEKEIRTLILKVVNDRKKEETSNNRDLLQAILENSDNVGTRSSESFIVDNCKAIYFAGYETTATTIKWALVLLALHPEWQNRARAEIFTVFAGEMPSFDKLHKMKTLTKVIQETLRLYPAIPFNTREALQNIKFGDFLFPKGTCISIPMASLHQDTTIWGEDAKIFNPERFANGPSKACKFPNTYMPFGMGPRICLGQNFAMLELKIILSLILTNFSFRISPNYKHSVFYKLVLDAEFGANFLVQKV